MTDGRDADLDALVQEIMLDDYYSSEEQIVKGQTALDGLHRLCREARNERDDAKISCDIFLHEEQAAKDRADAAEQHLGNLLARIHHDGGHYITKHGWEKAVADADRWIVEKLGEEREAASSAQEPGEGISLMEPNATFSVTAHYGPVEPLEPLPYPWESES